MSDEREPPEENSEDELSRVRRLARRLIRSEPRGEDDDETGDEARTRDIIFSALATGDKAKTEIVRMLAREVRAYVDALEVGKDINHLLTNYSLEVHASLSLKPLADKVTKEDSPQSEVTDE